MTYRSTDRLNLLLALAGALTGTWWGIGTALVVVAVLGCRVAARRHVRQPRPVDGSSPRWTAPRRSMRPAAAARP
jgi:hypothetical protein